MTMRRNFTALVLTTAASGLAAVTTLGEVLAVSAHNLSSHDRNMVTAAAGLVFAVAALLIASREPHEFLVIAFVFSPTITALVSAAIALMLGIESWGSIAPLNSLWMCFAASLVSFAVQFAIVTATAFRLFRRRSVS